MYTHGFIPYKTRTADTSRHTYFDDDYMLSGGEQALKDQTKLTYAQYIELLRQKRLDRLDMMYEYSFLRCSIPLETNSLYYS